jgi:hypothetical protein
VQSRQMRRPSRLQTTPKCQSPSQPRGYRSSIPKTGFFLTHPCLPLPRKTKSLPLVWTATIVHCCLTHLAEPELPARQYVWQNGRPVR